jgi:hypothetical protein
LGQGDEEEEEEEHWNLSLLTSKPPLAKPPVQKIVRVANRYQALASLDDDAAWPAPSALAPCRARAPAAEKATTGCQLGAAAAAVRASLRRTARACCLLQDECKMPLMTVGDQTWQGKKWQRIEFAVDSGAVATVIPPHAVCGMSVVPSAGSQAGHCYHTADGGELPNLGEVRIRGQTDDSQACSVTAQVADIVMPLLSVACVSEQGNTFHFGAKSGYIKNVASGRVTRLTKKGRLYHLTMWVELPFQRQ